MIPALRASNIGFSGTEMLSPRAAYDNLISDNQKMQEQEALRAETSLEHPAPPEGQGQKLDIVA